MDEAPDGTHRYGGWYNRGYYTYSYGPSVGFYGPGVGVGVYAADPYYYPERRWHRRGGPRFWFGFGY
jgi:hypothetical protein